MQLLHGLVVSFLIIFHSSYGSSFNKSGFELNETKLKKLEADKGYRLPGNARPSSYDVTLDFDPKTTLVKGEVLIVLDVDTTEKKKTSSIELNSAIKFSEKTKPIFVFNEKTENEVTCTHVQSDTHLTIVCPKPIEGKNQKLKITYETNLADSDYQGIQKKVYTENNKEKIIISTQFKPVSARRLFPCFDEPKYKATIKLTLKTNTKGLENSNWISNMEGKTDTKTGTTTFTTSPKISTYMLAFIFTQDFKSITPDPLKNEFGIYARSSAEEYLNTVLENGPRLINTMEAFTGIPLKTFDPNKMWFVAIPEHYEEASENLGLITFREELLMDEDRGTTARDKQSIIEMVAHEVAQQWFGNYVTMEWWSDSWLSEGLAQYFQYFLTDSVSSSIDSLGQFIVKGKQQALKLDAHSDAIALSGNADITTEKDIVAQLGEISSLKGASVLLMLRYTLEEYGLKQGLQDYLKSKAYANPTSKDLIDALQPAAPKTLKLNTIFKEWIYNSGYPLLHVSVDSENKVTVKATKFSSSPDKTADDNNKASWWVPLTYTTSKKPNFDKISFDWQQTDALSKYSVSLSEKDSWIIFNLKAIGFYRVNYDQELWNRIIATLNNETTVNTINVLNRAQLLDDIFNIAKYYKPEEEKGRLYYKTAFKLAEYLKFETEYQPWYTFFTEMQYLFEVIQDEETRGVLRAKILNIIPQPILPKDGSKPKHTEILKRNLLLKWACAFGRNDCVKWALDQFSSYKKNILSIDNNYRDVIVCTALSLNNGEAQDYLIIKNAIKNSNLPSEQMDLIKGIMCMKYDNIINGFLDQTLNKTTIKNAIFPRTYLDTVMSELYTGGLGPLDLALTFVLTNVERIDKYWHGFVNSKDLIKKIGSKIYDENLINKITDFILKLSEGKTEILNAAAEAVEIANKNVEYLKQYSNILKSVIVYNGGDPPTTTTSAPVEPTTKGGSNKIGCTLLLPILLALSLKFLL